MTTPRRRSSKTQSVVPPTADMVEGCPPHHWLVVSGRQTCKKCDLEQAVPAMTDTRTTTWQRRTQEKEGGTTAAAPEQVDPGEGRPTAESGPGAVPEGSAEALGGAD